MSINTVLKLLKSEIATRLNSPKLYGKVSYSQEGEDLILTKILDKKNGFYVDVGAHHPFRFSNTQLLYQKDWSGINIDPTPGTKKLFDRVRKGDTNLELGISSNKGDLTFYTFQDPALNTFDVKRQKEIIKSKQSRFLKKFRVKTNTLSEILDSNKVKGNFDLLNIDVEGIEMTVLKSNNWKKYKPNVVAIENFRNKSVIQNYLKSKGYLKFANTSLTEIYIHK